MNSTESTVVRRQSDDFAVADPIVLREKPTVRLIFRPTLVRNQQDSTKPLGGDFIYQKKKLNDQWEDDVTQKISDIEAGTGIRLELSRSELDLLLRHSQALYAFYRQNEIPGNQQRISIPETFLAFDDSTQSVIGGFVNRAGQSTLGQVLSWAAKIDNVESTIDHLTKLDIDSLQRINSIAGVSVLKKALTFWELEKENGHEETWQTTLQEYSFALSQLFSSPIIFFKDKAYLGGKGIENTGGKYADLLLKTELTKNILIIELKTPKTPLLGSVYRKPDIFPASNEVIGSVIQVAHYKDRLTKEYALLKEKSEDDDFNVFSPKCVVIAGNTEELKDKGRRSSFELFRNNLRDCEIITFDELFAKTKQLLELLENSQQIRPPF